MRFHYDLRHGPSPSDGREFGGGGEGRAEVVAFGSELADVLAEINYFRVKFDKQAVYIVYCGLFGSVDRFFCCFYL